MLPLSLVNSSYWRGGIGIGFNINPVHGSPLRAQPLHSAHLLLRNEWGQQVVVQRPPRPRPRPVLPLIGPQEMEI